MKFQLAWTSAGVVVLLAVIGAVWSEEKLPCTEECTGGFEKIPGLKHCYKFLKDLGPVSQDKAVTACGIEGGSTLVTFDNVGDDQIVRDHLFSKYEDVITSSPAFLTASGFWTGYLRNFGDTENPFVNMISGAPMDTSMFRPGQPDDEILGKFGGEACVCRKKITHSTVDQYDNLGLDDFTCSFPNWAVCMHRDVYALNKQAWNSALMYDQEGSQLPADGTCELDWEDQNRYQLYMMRDKRLEKGFEGAQELADKYMEILNTDVIQTPVCHLVQ
ncbi:uncharacterized protein LOC134854258 [Symsagittifera roscoffensis]|uniref:uncharacterized protein LOC134854258 n=1 Tax=Symsagittifera roscoffensis TaxID=84072 RepID=UPI00307C03AC